MKKYLKYKFEEAGCTGHFTPNGVEEPHPSPQNVDEDIKLRITVQPPLPPNSPPPDNLPPFVLKKEIEDDDYEKSSVDNTINMGKEALSESEKPKPTEVTQEKPKKTMCKDFVRGICKRGESCIYAHELDLSQLNGVYKFCRDFANGKCKRAMCYFVHASTFEMESFFRTGYLPPHTLSHLKETNHGGGQTMPEGEFYKKLGRVILCK